MAQTPTQAVRVAITDAELRRIALNTNTRVSALVAAALRGCYPLTPDAEPSVRPARTKGNPPA